MRWLQGHAQGKAINGLRMQVFADAEGFTPTAQGIPDAVAPPVRDARLRLNRPGFPGGCLF